LNNIISDYEYTVNTCYKITDAHNKLDHGLEELLKKIEVCQCGFYKKINNIYQNKLIGVQFGWQQKFNK